MARPNRSRKEESMPATPIDVRQRALQDAEAKVHAEMAKYQKVIEEAPRKAAERAREERDALLRRAARTDKRPTSIAALPDWRQLEVSLARNRQQRQTRAERRQGRMMFLFLLLALAGAIFFFYYTITHP